MNKKKHEEIDIFFAKHMLENESLLLFDEDVEEAKKQFGENDVDEFLHETPLTLKMGRFGVGGISLKNVCDVFQLPMIIHSMTNLLNLVPPDSRNSVLAVVIQGVEDNCPIDTSVEKGIINTDRYDSSWQITKYTDDEIDSE